MRTSKNPLLMLEHTLDVSAEFPASVSASSLFVVSRAVDSAEVRFDASCALHADTREYKR